MAVVETMTVHKALSELKVIDDRIKLAIADGVFIKTNKHSNEKIDGLTIPDFEKMIQGDYDRASDLIKRQAAIKRAVTLSNAVTKVSISDAEYTVAEAIWMKNHGMDMEKMFLEHLKNQYAMAKMVLEQQNGNALEERAEKYVLGMYGQKEGKTNTDEIEKAKREYIKSNTYDIIDPIKIVDKIDALERKINDFMVEVDSALSVSNAVTEITVEY